MTSEPGSKQQVNNDAPKSGLNTVGLSGRGSTLLFNQLQQHMNTLFTQPSSETKCSTMLVPVPTRHNALGNAIISQQSPQNQQESLLSSSLTGPQGKASFGKAVTSPEKQAAQPGEDLSGQKK